MQEVLEFLNAKRGGRFVDMTLGGAGHAHALLETSASSELLGIDRDRPAILRSQKVLSAFASRAHFFHGSFLDLEKALESISWKKVEGIFADLGVSSFQLDEAERGFSFRNDAPLDMRMDQSSEMSAADWINSVDEEEMADVFFHYGEERFSRKIAKKICEQREVSPFLTTRALAECIESVFPASWRRKNKIHPATRVFQAIRIYINGELDQLEHLLKTAPAYLSAGGRFVVLSYHSLEDRLVKRAFRDLEKEGEYSLPLRRVLIPCDEEIAANPRARSAKLRVLERKS